MTTLRKYYNLNGSFKDISISGDLGTAHCFGSCSVGVKCPRSVTYSLMIVLASDLIHFLVVLSHVEVGVKFLVLRLVVSHLLNVYINKSFKIAKLISWSSPRT